LIKTQLFCNDLSCDSRSVGPPASTSTTSVVADTGATGNFGTTDLPVINKRPTTKPIAIHTANGGIMYSTHEAELDFPDLPLAARHVHIVPALAEHTLISIGQLCDAGCHVAFTSTTVTVSYQDRDILHGKRSPDTRLWQFDLIAKHKQTAMSAVGSATPAELVAFAHATLFSPALSTLETALTKGYLTNFPGLTRTTLKKHPPRSAPMVKGHLDQKRKNTQSTKPKPPKEPEKKKASPPDLDTFPLASTEQRCHNCYVAVMQPTGQIYTDQTGKFIQPSSNGNNYLIILYDYDSNGIFAEPMKTRTAKSILAAYRTLHTRLCRAGLRPRLQRLDNECSAILKEFLTAEDIDFQLAPPSVHRRNAAERAIRTWKNHFIAALCSVDKDFPIHLWDRLIPQAEVTLNLLRGS